MKRLCSARKALIPKKGSDYSEPEKNAAQPFGMGGLHRAPQGDSTRDDPQLALFWFETERALYAGTADRAW